MVGISLFFNFQRYYIRVIYFRVSSAMLFGATAGIGVTYATEWKLILQYLPYYNGKYSEE